MGGKESTVTTPSEPFEDVVIDQAEIDAGFGNFWRVFTYADRLGWLLNGISFVAACASGMISFSMIHLTRTRI